MSTYIDNIKIIGAKNSEVISWVKNKLIATFEMVDIEPISFYFSLKISQNREKKIIKLFPFAYIDKILAKFHLSQANTSNISIKETLLEPSKKEAITVKQEY